MVLKRKMKFGKNVGRYLKDGLHPDVEGQQLMGQYIAKKIQDYLTVVCAQNLFCRGFAGLACYPVSMNK